MGSLIGLRLGTLQEFVKVAHIVRMDTGEVLPNRIDLVWIGTDQFTYITFIPESAGGILAKRNSPKNRCSINGLRTPPPVPCAPRR